MPPNTYNSPLKASLSLDLSLACGNCTIHPEPNIPLPTSPRIDFNNVLNNLLNNFVQKEVSNTIEVLDLANFDSLTTNNNLRDKQIHTISKKDNKRVIGPLSHTSKKSPNSSIKSRRIKVRTNTFHSTLNPLSFLTGNKSKQNSIIYNSNSELCFYCSSNLRCSDSPFVLHSLDDHLFVQMEELDSSFLEIC